MSIYVGIKNKIGGHTNVIRARPYQIDAYNTFMLNYDKVDALKFDLYNGQYSFTINKFDSKIFNGDYPHFLILLNNNGEEHILSNEKKILEGFIGWRNRLSVH